MVVHSMKSITEFNESNREYVSLSNAYIGHLMTGSMAAVCVSFLYWIYSVFFAGLRIDFQSTIVFLFLTVAISELIVSLLQRPLVVKAQHASPGGFLYAFYEVCITPCVAFLLSTVIFEDAFISRAWSILFGCVLVFIACYTKPWQRGLSREEIRERYKQTRELIREEAQKEHAKQHDKF